MVVSQDRWSFIAGRRNMLFWRLYQANDEIYVFLVKLSRSHYTGSTAQQSYQTHMTVLTFTESPNRKWFGNGTRDLKNLKHGVIFYLMPFLTKLLNFTRRDSWMIPTRTTLRCNVKSHIFTYKQKGAYFKTKFNMTRCFGSSTTSLGHALQPLFVGYLDSCLDSRSFLLYQGNYLLNQQTMAECMAKACS